jgi:hypothetical protein
VNATDDGRIVHSNSPATCRNAPRHQPPKPNAVDLLSLQLTIQIKYTAFLGEPLLSTFPIHDDPGSTPSLATAYTRRDAATMATLVFWHAMIRQPTLSLGPTRPATYDHESRNRNERHDDLSAPSQSHRVEQHKWLRRCETKERVDRRRAHEKQKDDRLFVHSPRSKLCKSSLASDDTHDPQYAR